MTMTLPMLWAFSEVSLRRARFLARHSEEHIHFVQCKLRDEAISWGSWSVRAIQGTPQITGEAKDYFGLP